MAIASRRTGKYKYKGVTWDDISEGVRLRVHTKEWFDVNSCRYDNKSDVLYRLVCTSLNGIKLDTNFLGKMIDMCGQVVTVSEIQNKYYIVLEEDKQFCWFPEMFECVVS